MALSQNLAIKGIDRWAQTMRQYFLGFIAQDTLSSRIASIASEHPEIQDQAARDEAFKHIEPFLVSEKHSHKYILDRIRRKFFHTYEALKPYETSSDTIFKHKPIPDNCIAVAKGPNRFDIRSLEEYGFVECQGVLVSRTFQAYANYNADGSISSDKPITEPTILIIPKQTEHKFYDNFPFVRTFNQDAIVLSAEFTPIKLKPAFVSKFSIPTDVALAAIAYKEQVDFTPELSKKHIDTKYLKSVMF